MAELTLDRLKQLFDYCPETGHFIRIKCSNPSFIGKKAGSTDRKGKTSYVRVRIDGKDYYAHRLALFYMTGVWPDIVDHIDGDGTNNRLSNLRDVDKSANGMNRLAVNKNNTSGIAGVHYCKRDSVWWAYIDSMYKRTHLGYFGDLFEAACVRKAAEITSEQKMFGAV